MSIPELKIAEQLFSKKRLETGAVRRETTILQGTALSDSEDGYVAVDYPGNVTVGETTEIRIPTGPAVKEGDQVEISLTGGVGKSPMVSNVPGWGDRQQQQINRSLTAYTDDSTYYLLSATVPATPTDETWEAAGWSTTEPVVSQEDTRTLYVSRRVELVDGTVTWSAPAKVVTSASIEVAKNAILATVSETYATKDEALNTASGSDRSITTTDAAGLPLRDLTVYGESVQDGTPTPDAPVEIRTVSGVNLADPSAFQNGYMAATAEGTVDPGLAAQSATMKEQTTAYIPVIAGESYTFYTANSSGEQGWLAYRFFDSAYTTIANRPAKAYAGESASFDDIVAPSNAAYVRMSARMYDDGVMMVSRSAMPFVPYGSIGIGVTHDGTETVAPIDLQGHTLASLPDGTQDVLHVENGRAWIEKNVGKLVFDGDETVTADRTKAQLDSWAIRGTYDMDWKYSTRADRRVLSDQDTVTSSYAVQPSLWSAATTPGVSVWNDGVYIRATKSLFANADAVESWLSANPLQILYPLLDTEIIDLGEVSLPTVQDGDTVRIVAEVQPVFDTSWWRDTDIVGGMSNNIDGIERAQASADSAYNRADEVERTLSTSITTTASGIRTEISSISKSMGEITTNMEVFDFTTEGLSIGKQGSSFKSNFNESSLTFEASGHPVLALDGQTSAVSAGKFKIGSYVLQNMGGALALVYVGSGS